MSAAASFRSDVSSFPTTAGASQLFIKYSYSPQSGVNLITRREDPRFSSWQNLEAPDLTLGEPDAKLFNPTSDFRTIDLGKPPEISSRQPSPLN
jgi:hypothetical protein